MRKSFAIGVLVVSLCGTAEAGVKDWPGVSQLYRVGACILATSGDISSFAISRSSEVLVYAAGKVVEIGSHAVQKVAECLVHTVDEVTPDVDPNA